MDEKAKLLSQEEFDSIEGAQSVLCQMIRSYILDISACFNYSNK